jgi:hypothetical protein
MRLWPISGWAVFATALQHQRFKLCLEGFGNSQNATGPQACLFIFASAPAYSRNCWNGDSLYFWGSFRLIDNLDSKDLGASYLHQNL